jgi:hypothetical protein
VYWKAGDVVCCHPDGKAESSWVGEVESVHGDPADESVEVAYYIKQLGRQQVTKFICPAEELRETVLTFEGPMCVECKRPY